MVDTEHGMTSPTQKETERKNGFPWIPTIIMMLVVFALFAYGGYRFAEWYITRNLFHTSRVKKRPN